MPSIRLTIFLGLVLGPSLGEAQSARLTAADSALVGRILLAEDRRDSTDRALTLGAQHRDERIRVIARRALGRIRDADFGSRDSLPTPPSPAIWPEPAWKSRYRALGEQREDCQALQAALGDSVWPVRLRAADLATSSCAPHDALSATLAGWIDSLPADLSRRTAGQVSWHAAAHALVALARLRPDEARPRVAQLAEHDRWQLRMYAARAAAVLDDTATLRALAADRNDNVRELAIESLSKLTGHADDEVYLAALAAAGPQAVRVAAAALEGSPHPQARPRLERALRQWSMRGNQSERDARVALLKAAGRPESNDRPPASQFALPPRAVALALGADVRLRVTMAGTSGGGSFVVRLRGDVAPMMAARILALAGDRYYDGLTWHRVAHDFVIQGGSPGANEYVGLAQYLRDELGTVPHLRGTVGMSTRGRDTGDAQWFINLKDNLRLNRDYTVFAEVVEGIDVVDGIMEGDVIESIRVERPRPRGSRPPSNDHRPPPSSP